jgi:hypothetical protein
VQTGTSTQNPDSDGDVQVIWDDGGTTSGWRKAANLVLLA